MKTINGVQYNLVMAGTGHRPVKLFTDSQPYSLPNYNKLKEFAKETLQAAQKHGLDCVISGMALGWDMALAEATIELNIPLIAACPCYNQASKWPPTSFLHWEGLIKKATYVIHVHNGPYTNTCMQERNEWMVDNCDVLLELWDGSAGGTGNCVKYARSIGRKEVNLWGYWLGSR